MWMSERLYYRLGSLMEKKLCPGEWEKEMGYANAIVLSIFPNHTTLVLMFMDWEEKNISCNLTGVWYVLHTIFM